MQVTVEIIENKLDEIYGNSSIPIKSKMYDITHCVDSLNRILKISEMVKEAEMQNLTIDYKNILLLMVNEIELIYKATCQG